MTDRRTARALAVLVTALALHGCSGGSSSGGPKIDPNAPDELAFQAALAHYDAGTAAQAAARNPAEPDPAGKNALAVAEFGAAQAGFHQLQIDFPASVRIDNSAYLEGRCRYEIGTITGLRSDFAAAWTLLEGAIAAHPASAMMSSIAYFAGRSMYHLAELDRALSTATAAIQGEYAQARAQFARSVAVNPGPPWGDNAAYYEGRCDYEVGFLDVHPLDPLATPVLDPAPFDLAEAELAAIPGASSYYDNARFYLGRSFFEEPAPTPTARLANLSSAIAAFTTVASLTGPSSYAVSATFWRGRAHYALAFQLGSGGAVDQPELALALADMKAVAPTTSVYADNALYFEAKSYLHFAAPGPYCSTARAGDTAPASACGAYRGLVATYPASTYVAQTEAYLLANGCDPALCPP